MRNPYRKNSVPWLEWERGVEDRRTGKAFRSVANVDAFEAIKAYNEGWKAGAEVTK